jgi:hypothetical protein
MAGSLPPPPPPAPLPNAPQWMSPPPTAPMAAMRTLMPSASFLLRVLGFTLLFVAALVVVSFAYPGGGCFTSATSTSCGAGSSYESGAANAILAGHILFALGAFLLGIGAGIKIHFTLQTSATGSKEENRFIIADRWFNGLVLLLSIWILLTLLTGASIASL